MNGLATGKHSRRTYAALLFSIRRGGHCGTLEITSGRRKREIRFIAGEAVSYSSDIPEEQLGKSLVGSGLVPKDRLKWILDKLGPDESVETALLMSGALTEEALAQHKAEQLPARVGAALAWTRGSWTFTPLEGLRGSSIDPALLPDLRGLSGLWRSVKKEVATNDVMVEVTEKAKGVIRLCDGGQELFEELNPDEPCDKFLSALGDGCDVEGLFKAIPDVSGDLFRLLWLLEAGGVVAGEGPGSEDVLAAGFSAAANGEPEESNVVESPRGGRFQRGRRKGLKARPGDRASERKATTSSRRTAETSRPSSSGGAAGIDIAREHSNRMGKDFYAFLGLEAAASRRDVDRACKSLAKTWRPLENKPGVSAATATQVKELLAGVQLVWRTLTDPKHKREYDRRLSTGRAPVVEIRIPGSSPGMESSTRESRREEPRPTPAPQESSVDPAAEAAELVSKGRFAEAHSILEKQRLDNPSDPWVLASLGWVKWRLRGKLPSGGDGEGPEEFIELALTFDRNNTLALEYKARIAMDKGDNENAGAALKDLLSIDSNHHWAKGAFERLNRDSSRGGDEMTRKRRFWRSKEER